MKNNKALVNLSLVFAMLFCMAFACNDNDSQPNGTTQTKPDPDSQTDGSTADNNSSVGKSKIGGSLTDDIIGTWEDENSRATFTFGKDGSVTIDEDDEDEHQNGIYSVIDAETFEIKQRGKTSGLRMKVKINGDTMQLTGGPSGGTSTLKRIS
ncbi:MAG: DUF5640 domain-containing protein [Acidobacteriota bacterium]|nr:DUF5640 domain-containing protein [Acidobacteriota bacterium]